MEINNSIASEDRTQSLMQIRAKSFSQLSEFVLAELVIWDNYMAYYSLEGRKEYDDRLRFCFRHGNKPGLNDNICSWAYLGDRSHSDISEEQCCYFCEKGNWCPVHLIFQDDDGLSWQLVGMWPHLLRRRNDSVIQNDTSIHSDFVDEQENDKTRAASYLRLGKFIRSEFVIWNRRLAMASFEGVDIHQPNFEFQMILPDQLPALSGVECFWEHKGATSCQEERLSVPGIKCKGGRYCPIHLNFCDSAGLNWRLAGYWSDYHRQYSGSVLYHSKRARAVFCEK